MHARTDGSPPPSPSRSRAGVSVVVWAVILVLSAAWPAAAQERFDYAESSAELVWRGTQALKICNGLFVSGRAMEDIRRQELAGLRPSGPYPEDRIHVDHRRRIVRVGGGYGDPLPGMLSAFREGIGCVVMGAGDTVEDVANLPEVRLPPFPGDPTRIAWPDGDLVERKPLPAGVDARALEAAADWAFDREAHGGHAGQVTLSLLVVHRGDILLERYAPGFDHTTRTRTWSTAKSIASSVIGIAVEKGLLGLDAPLPIEWDVRGDGPGAPDVRSGITLRHVLNMSSGLYPMDDHWNWVRGSHMVYFGGWDAAFHPRDRGLLFQPGSVFNYENYDILLGLHALKVALGGGDAYKAFPHEELLRKIGMRNTLLGMDRYGNYVMSSQIYTNARDLARFGLLYLNGGRWNGEQIIPEEWVEFVRTPAPSTRGSGRQYGGQFWLVPDSRTDLPQDAYTTNGAQGQYAIIVPSYDLVIVRRGLDWREGSPGPGLNAWDILAEILKAFPPGEGGRKLGGQDDA